MCAELCGVQGQTWHMKRRCVSAVITRLGHAIEIRSKYIAVDRVRRVGTRSGCQITIGGGRIRRRKWGAEMEVEV